MSPRKIIILVAVVCVIILALVWSPRRAAVPMGNRLALEPPLGLPPVSFPEDNPATFETVALGWRLFYDPILSQSGKAACVDCHHPERGFASDKKVKLTVGGRTVNRNAPSLLNTAYNTAQYWDGRTPGLEEQVRRQILNPAFLDHSLQGVESRLMGEPRYAEQFARAFGPGPITHEMVEKALASFERTLLSGNSPFDRWYYGGEETAVSEAAKRGFEVFRNPEKGNCTACHTIGEQFALFTDNRFHNVGSSVDAHGEIGDPGRFAATFEEADRGAFRTPTLRNIMLTRPYLHDGSLQELKHAVDFYIGGGNSNANLDRNIRSLDFLTGEERADLLAFLESLTGEMPPNTGRPPVAQTADLEK